MNILHHEDKTASAASNPLTLADGDLLDLGRDGGRLDVLGGRVWLTRAGDLDDHFVTVGESLDVAPSRRALLESLGRRTAVVAWQPRRAAHPAVQKACDVASRCWQLMHPAARVGLGSTAALLALLAGDLLFGPVSDARSRALAAATIQHNAVALTSSLTTPSNLTHDRRTDRLARRVAQEARRRPAGPA